MRAPCREVLLLCLLLGCSSWEASEAPPEGASGNAGEGSGGSNPGGGNCAQGAPQDDYPRGLHAVGNVLQDANGTPVTLRGVNRSGTEYACVDGNGIFDGPSDEASVRAMASWPINAVRVPLNESCWLGINGVDERFSGAAYRSAITAYVQRLHRYALIPILELHWAAPGDNAARILRQMPNADHSLDFWRDVAVHFAEDDGVVFEAFNEPYPDRNRDTVAAWECWKNGCTLDYSSTSPGWEATGMQNIVSTIRETGSKHLIVLGGVQYSNGLSRWLEYKPTDPEENLAAAWHAYDFNPCGLESCWANAPAAVAEVVPLIATEVGQGDCVGKTFLKPLLQFLDERSSGYLAWSWNRGSCIPRTRNDDGTVTEGWAMIDDFSCPKPGSLSAQVFYDHLLGLAP